MSNDEQVIFNLLQISDLHFGNLLGGDTADALNARLPLMLAKNKHMDGLLGHHYKALSALHDFYRALWTQNPRCLLAVTGDLTANGAESQFDLAQGYLGSECPESAFGLGLGHDDWAATSVAGNHDHWPGNNRVLGWPTAGLTKYLRTDPAIGPLLELRPELSLRFLFVNSDADVKPFGYNRFWARGHFVSQLAKLRDELPQMQDGEVRVLIIHHSLMTKPTDAGADHPPPKKFFPPPLEMTDHSRKTLERFLVEFDIRVMLCGHLHVPRLDLVSVSNGTESAEVLEARCGTTTQRDCYPYELDVDRTRKLAPNTLVLHQIIYRQRSFVWKAEVFWRNRSGRFVSAPNHNALMPRELRKEISLASRRV